MDTKRLLGSLVVAATVGGCMVGPNYRTPQVQTPSAWSGITPAAPESQPSASQPSGPTTQPADVATWWQALGDPTLNRLVEQAVASNLDLRIAAARVRQARAQRDIAVAAFWPQVNTSGGYTYSGVSANSGSRSASTGGSPARHLPVLVGRPGTTNNPGSVSLVPSPISVGGNHAPGITVQPPAISVPGGLGTPTITVSPPGTNAVPEVSRQLNLFQAGFDATWELDVFGGIRRGIEAGNDTLEASEESRRDALVTLISEVALNYVQLRGSQRRLAIVDQNIAAQQSTVELTQQRHQAGFANELDVAQAQALLATTQSQVPLLETSVRQAIYQLGVLLGLTPEALVAELEQAAPIPTTPPDVPIGLPCDLLRRRPDVRAAERQLAAATAQIGVAMADLFPKVSLTGSFGTATSDMRHFLDARSLLWSIGPGVSWPVFTAGRIRANIELQNGLQEEALATYEKAVLTAFQDVENALVAYTNEKTRYQTLTRAVASNQEATDLSIELYSRGLTAFLNVLSSQGALYAAQDQLVQSETTAVQNLIALYKALGGGWEGPGDPKSQ